MCAGIDRFLSVNCKNKKCCCKFSTASRCKIMRLKICSLAQLQKKTSSMQESIGKTICFLRKSETSTHGAKNKKDVPHMKKLEVYGIR